MDRRERIGDPEELTRIGFDSLQSQIWTALPGIVQSFDHVNNTVAVQPAIRGKVRNQDGSQVSVNMPMLLDCPVVWQGGGGCTLTFPIVQGDECLVVFASRCIDSWWQSGGIQEQAEFRMHDLSDGFALVGLKSLPRAFAVATDKMQLRSDDGQAAIEINPATHAINFNTTGAMTINASTLTINANVAATGSITSNGKHIDSTHTHSGVQTGGGNTGVPNP